MTDSLAIQRLLPCPFCGSAPEMVNDGGHGLGNVVTEIKCMNLDCIGLVGTAYLEEWEARKLWNTRAAAQPKAVPPRLVIDPDGSIRPLMPKVKLPQRWHVWAERIEGKLDLCVSPSIEGEWIRTDDVLSMLQQAGIAVEGEEGNAK